MKIIIGDSSELFIIGLQTLISKIPNAKIIETCKTKEELLAIKPSKEDNVLIIDYTTKYFGIDILPQVLTKNPNFKIIAITPEQSAQTLVHAIRSGVKSYIKKDCDAQEIIDSINDTWNGKRFFCGQILETIRNASLDVEDIEVDGLSCEPVSISDRENEIVIKIAEGLTNQQIADELCLSNHTINTHRKNIMSKLGVKNTAGIVMYAVKTNLISPNKFLFAGEN